jgi:tetratricopeptide (TPR) repeat protein
MVSAALARLAIARGDLPAAEELLRSAVEQRPLPEFAVALGDLLESQGRASEAHEQYELVRATQQLLAANGVNTDIELVLFDADRGADPPRTYERALAAYAARQTIYAADTVAWAAYKAGRVDEAQRYMRDALRLGTRDPRIAYHAGIIAQAAGDTPAAQAHLRAALAAEHALPLTYAADARAALDALTAEAARPPDPGS